MSQKYRALIQLSILLILVGSLLGCTSMSRTPEVSVTSENATITVTASGYLQTIEPTPEPSLLLQLTFVSEVSGKYGVYASNITLLEDDLIVAEESELLFEWGDFVNDADWSPDGSKVAFIEGLYSNDLYIADWNGENPIQITDGCDAASSPQWSSDGSKVAFIYHPGRPDCDSLGSGQIRLYDVETKQIITVLNNAFVPERIYWLPDGNFAYIAPVSEHDYRNILRYASADGTIIQQQFENLTNRFDLLDISFSPEANQMVISGTDETDDAGNDFDIFVYDFGTGDIRPIPHGIHRVLSPSWSPVGDIIAFMGVKGSPIYGIYLFSLPTNTVLKISNDTDYSRSPAWRMIESP